MPKLEVPTFSELTREVQSAIRRAALRPSIAGYKPQPHQERFHSSNKKGKLFIGGNRSGKTVGGGAESVYMLTGEHPFHETFRPPVYGRAVGVDFDNGVKKIMMPEIARWIPPSLLKHGSWEESYSKGEKMLTLTNGSTLEFMSYDQDVDKFAGTSRHFTWFDEEPPEDIFNECLLRLVDRQGKWWMTMTPLIEMSWTFDRLYEKAKNGVDPNIDVFEVMTSENLYVSQSELAIILEGMAEEEIEARSKGVYIQQSGTIYSASIDTKVNYIPPLWLDEEEDGTSRWEAVYRHWGHFGMLDHGFSNPTAFYLGAFDAEGRIIIYDEYYFSKRLVGENAKAILERIAELKLQEKLQYVVGDPSIRNTDPITGSSIQAEYAEHGLYIGLANNDVAAGILRVSSRFKNRQLFITRNCEKLIWELGRYRWDKYASTKIGARRNAKETPLKKDDHGCDALRYGVVSRPALDGEVDMPVGNVLNTPVSRSNYDKDFSLLSMLGNNERHYSMPDYTLGADY